ncbi:MAG TPA: fused MFS/spermidine synthase [Pyrinomonadaceae bacterium]|nr:fused MFS/spermidine synthase [Pyrinomonadaceae bacterium]
MAVCFTLSGAAGLIYEVLWMRMLGLVFGATTVAISVVLTAFMGGLALGSAIGGKVAGRLGNALRAYGVIEIAIGFCAICLPLIFRFADALDATVWRTIHPGGLLFGLFRFVTVSAVLLIPTMLMGATLPIIISAVRQFGDSRAVTISRLYGLNLLGAIVGTIIAAFFFLPAFGIRLTIWIAAATNIGVGIAVLLSDRWSHSHGHSTNRQSLQADIAQAEVLVIAENRRAFWFICAFCSGLVTIGMQIIWSRLLAMIIGSSTYAFALVLALFLLGLALGAWIVSLTVTSDSNRPRRVVFLVQLFTVVALFMSLKITNAVPEMLVSIGFRFGINSWAGLLALQALAAMILILVPATLMGMIMPIVLTWAAQSPAPDSSVAKTVGQAYALNTLGAIAGALVTTFVLVPMASSKFAAFCMAAISLGVAAVACQRGGSEWDRTLVRSLSVGAAAVLMIAMLFVWPRLNLSELSVGAYDSYIRVLAKARGGAPTDRQSNRPDDHRLLMYAEGRTATVSVRRDWGITSVAINGRTNASDADDMPTQVMLGQLGVLTAPRLDNGLIVGFATGVTAGSVLQSPIKSLEGVEIEPAAIASSSFFEHVNNRPLQDLRLRMIVDDARTYLRVNPTQYDLIVSEPSHPWVPGVANLFTREFFALGRERLRDDGIFVQWLQIYQLSTENLRSVLATFHQVFPHAAVFRIEGSAKGKDLILIGSRQPIRLDLISDRMKDERVAADLKRVGLANSTDVMAWFVCDESKLGPAVAGAVINADDNMHVETVAPREAFRPTMDENSAWIDKLRTPSKP